LDPRPIGPDNLPETPADAIPLERLSHAARRDDAHAGRIVRRLERQHSKNHEFAVSRATVRPNAGELGAADKPGCPGKA
jgi:hypothetical protein